MKTRINIMVSNEVKDILDKQPNRSQYIENLILGGTSNVNIGLRAANQIEEIHAELIIKSKARGTSTVSWEDLHA